MDRFVDAHQDRSPPKQKPAGTWGHSSLVIPFHRPPTAWLSEREDWRRTAVNLPAAQPGL